MTFKSALPWITRTLAVVGLVSILFFLARGFSHLFSATNPSYDQKESAGFAIDLSVSEEKSIRTPSPNGFLYDEAIAAEIDEKIIKTGSLDLVVDKADESLAQVEEIAQFKGGYVQTSTLQEHEDGTKSGYVTIRVPADQFDITMALIKELALVVERETSSVEDVTEQYIDLAARLKNAQAQEARYVEILDVATTVEEILKIEEALGNIRGYIESLQGQLQYLDNLTDFSTMTVSFSEEPIITVAGKEFRPGTSIKEAAQTVVAIAQWFVVVVIWIVIVGVGVGVSLAVIVWLVLRGVSRLRKR